LKIPNVLCGTWEHVGNGSTMVIVPEGIKFIGDSVFGIITPVDTEGFSHIACICKENVYEFYIEAYSHTYWGIDYKETQIMYFGEFLLNNGYLYFGTDKFERVKG
jgi:hypothetical protein